MDKTGTVIIGAGAVGSAIAHELLLRGHQDIFVFERGKYLAEGQSGRNSGVVHAGLYYQKGSLKTKLCVEGNALMYEFCGKSNIPCVRTGKLVVAVNEAEAEAVERLFERAKDNGVAGLKMLTSKEVAGHEPNISAVSAMFVPSTGSVDAATYVKTLAGLSENMGAMLLMGSEVVGIEPAGDDLIVNVRRPDGNVESIETELLINAAGLFSDRIAKMVNPNWTRELLPVRGEYYKFNRARRANIGMKGMNVYPAPQFIRAGGEDLMVVGIHLTPTFGLLADGSVGLGNIVTVGPEFAPVEDREDYETGRKPKEVFYEGARRFFPGLQMDDLEMDFTGIMANMGSGKDWVIERDELHPNCIQLVGIDSPALTSSLAIARHVADMVDGQGTME